MEDFYIDNYYVERITYIGPIEDGFLECWHDREMCPSMSFIELFDEQAATLGARWRMLHEPRTKNRKHRYIRRS